MPMKSPFKGVGKASYKQFLHKCELDPQAQR